jgi:hypothetical protein
MYVPTMQAYHHVPASGMTQSYFRRWWFWRGVSRARLDRMHPVTEEGIDLARVPHMGGMPRFMIVDMLRLAARWLGAAIRLAAGRRRAYEMLLAYNAGYLKEHRRDPGADRGERRGARLTVERAVSSVRDRGPAKPDITSDK